MFKWKKKGILFRPNNRFKWMSTHAQVPYTFIFDKYIRIYFSTREAKDKEDQFRSFSGYIDIDKQDFSKIIDISKEPIIKLGNTGEFDEYGSMAGSIIKHNNEYYLYYCGWTRQVSVPYNWSIGLAKSKEGKQFKKIGKGPILGPTVNEPYLQACPIVYKISEDEWHMFYLSGIKWIAKKDKKESQYLLMHAESKDGVTWKRNGKPIIEPLVEDECQTSASIIKRDNVYHMFFSYRFGTEFRENSDKSYRIGYAYSSDLKNWTRDDKKAGIDISGEGWDSKMVGYPHLFELENKVYMLYCGNNFGKDGFGYAILEED